MKPIVLSAFAIFLSFTGCQREPTTFPYASAAKLPALHNKAEWERVETLGNTDGPFRGLGGHELNAGALRKRVFYTQGGAQVERDLDIKEDILLERYDNPQGDSLVVVYKRRPK